MLIIHSIKRDEFLVGIFYKFYKYLSYLLPKPFLKCSGNSYSRCFLRIHNLIQHTTTRFFGTNQLTVCNLLSPVQNPVALNRKRLVTTKIWKIVSLSPEVFQVRMSKYLLTPDIFCYHTLLMHRNNDLLVQQKHWKKNK